MNEDQSYFRIPRSLEGRYRSWDTTDFKGWVDTTLFGRFAPDLKTEPEGLFALPDMEIVRDRRNFTVKVSIDNLTLWIKRFRPAHTRDRIVYAMRAGKSVYAWNAAMALTEQGFCTPRPLIGLRRPGRTGGAEGIIAFEDLGDHVSLGELMSDGERDQVMSELGNCLRRFHDLGFRHRDLRQGNILATKAGGSWRFCFLDLNRLRIQAPLTEIQRLREIEKLNLPVNGLEAFFRSYHPQRDSHDLATAYTNRVQYADRLEHLPLGRLIKKTWYYSWELRAFSRARRP